MQADYDVLRLLIVEQGQCYLMLIFIIKLINNFNYHLQKLPLKLHHSGHGHV